MENATKALLIAAAVLVVILIISLGIGLFTMASEQVDNAGDLSEYQIQQFNSKFTKYEGKNKTGSDVNALIKTVFNHNQLQQEDAYSMVEVRVDNETVIGGKPSDFNGAESPKQVSTGKRYDVECTFNANTKLVELIKITTK